MRHSGKIEIHFKSTTRSQASAADLLSVLGCGKPWPKCGTCGGVVKEYRDHVQLNAVCTCPEAPCPAA